VVHRAAVAVVLALAPLAGRQEGASEAASISGRVLRADGSAWSDAVVVLHSLPWHLPDEAESLDRVATRSDADGAFRAAVRPGRTYSAWACSEIDGNRYRTSEPASGSSAGQSITLRARAEAQRVVRVGVHGLEAWEERAPFAFEALCLLADRVVVPCEMDDEGLVVLGPLPTEEVLLRVRDRGGAELVSVTIPLAEGARRERAAASPGTLSPRPGGVVTVSETRSDAWIPAPVPLRLELAGPRGPLREARVLWTERADRRLVAESDRKGRVELLVPGLWGEAGEPFLRSASFRIEAPGCATVQWWAEELACRDAQGDVAVVPLTLPRGRSIEGRLSWSRGRPAANVPLLVHTGVPTGSAFEGRRGTFEGAPWVARTDTRGRFEIDGLSEHLGWQLSVLLPAEVQGELAGPRGYRLAPVVVLASGEDASSGGGDLGSLVLSAYRPVDVEVRTAAGAAAACVDLAFREELSAAMQEERVARVRTGPRGCVRLLARPGSTLLLAALGADGEPSEPEQRVEIARGKRAIEVSLVAR
jgi:hypothetical protein